MLTLLVKILFYVVFYGTPLIGFWIASSLAAHLGGAHWMPWAAGALLFPIIPGLWELYAWSRRKPAAKPWFTTADRIGMRTFVVGLAFLALLLSLYPQRAFVALSTRGDWMLDGVHEPRAQVARQYLLASAGGLEWLYKATRTNPYKAQIDPTAQQRSDEAAQLVAQDLEKQQSDDAVTKQSEEAQVDQENPIQQESPEQQETQKQQEIRKQKEDQKQQQDSWPWTGTGIHPAVANMPASVETSVESVAKYIAKKESDPVQRIKALHDYVADRIAYDADAYYSGNFPPQDAETVFQTRKAVCAGSANLLSALGSAIKEDIVVVTGDARNSTSDKLTGSGHAWNAAKIDGRWYLLDATWDAGFTDRKNGFKKSYRTEYFLIPPEVMIQDHLPENSTWQLLAKPLSQGEFLRQPLLEPKFQAEGLTLVSPQRAENEMGTSAVVVVKNPKNKWLMGTLKLNGQEIPDTTVTTSDNKAQFSYTLPNKGKYQLSMYAAKDGEYSTYDFIGSVDFVNR